MDEAAHKVLLVEYKMDFARLVNYMEHKPIGVEFESCKVVDIEYYPPQMDQRG